MAVKAPRRILLSLGAAALAGVGVSACSSNPPPDAAKLLATSQQAANNSYSVSYRLVATAKPTKTDPHPDVETIASELSPTASVESVRFTSGNGDLDAKLVNGIVYFRGAANILATALGLPTAAAQHYAGQWISIPDTNANFAAITNTLNLSTQVGLLYPAGKVTIGPEQTFHGHRVWPLSGPSTPDSSRKAGVTRILVDEKTHLPVASGVVAINHNNQQFSEAASFLAWGGHVQVKAPTTSVPIDTALAYH